MRGIVARILKRTKKYSFLFIAICLLLSLLGWFLPIEKEDSKFTTQAVLLLGKYENTYLNDVNQVMSLLTNEGSFQYYLPDAWEDDLLDSLRVHTGQNNQLTLTYTADSEAIAVNKLTEITEAFLDLDQQHFQARQSIIETSIDAVKSKEVSDDTVVDQQRFLYDLEIQLLAIKPAMLLHEVYVLEEGRSLSSKDRAILGALLGVTISVLLAFVPEFIRVHSE